MPNDVNDKNNLISLSDAATIYGFTADHLRHLIHRNRLKAKKLGGVWLTTRADVEEYISSRKKRGVFRDDISSKNH